jgi:hypothetical protein
MEILKNMVPLVSPRLLNVLANMTNVVLLAWFLHLINVIL